MRPDSALTSPLLALACGMLALLLPALLLLNLLVLPWVDGAVNAAAAAGEPIAAEVREFHDRSFVADLHADALLWGRDLRRRYTRGHIDLPRLEAGGIDLQVFSVVSKVPRQLNYQRNAGDSDQLPLLFVASLRAPTTWFDPGRRALAQAAELRRLAERSPLTLVLRRGDLDASGVKGLLALEGAHALGDDPRAVDTYFAAGFRMLGLAHFFDNTFAGSAHGVERHGLTPRGRELLARAERLGMTIDLAHVSPAAFADSLALATRPLVVSHVGVAGTCPGPRNLTDAQLRAVAANGGMIGIGFWPGAVCGNDIAAIVRAIRYALEVAGIDHVGLGSDFDGYVPAPFDAAGLPRLTAALLGAGLPQDDVARILGANLRRVLAANLPP